MMFISNAVLFFIFQVPHKVFFKIRSKTHASPQPRLVEPPVLVYFVFVPLLYRN